jgi:hypothetical protein
MSSATRIKKLEEMIVRTDKFIIRLEARKKKLSEELARKKAAHEAIVPATI